MLNVLDHYEIEYQEMQSDRYKGLCPFHDDRDPSLYVYFNDNGIWSFSCYVCSLAGDSFEFIRHKEENFSSALEVLKMLTGDYFQQSILQRAGKQLREGTFVQSLEEDPKEIDTWRYMLGVLYREFLKSRKHHIGYIDACSWVDQQFKEMDVFFHRDPSYQEAKDFFKKKRRVIKQYEDSSNSGRTYRSRSSR